MPIAPASASFPLVAAREECAPAEAHTQGHEASRTGPQATRRGCPVGSAGESCAPRASGRPLHPILRCARLARSSRSRSHGDRQWRRTPKPVRPRASGRMITRGPFASGFSARAASEVLPSAAHSITGSAEASHAIAVSGPLPGTSGGRASTSKHMECPGIGESASPEARPASIRRVIAAGTPVAGGRGRDTRRTSQRRGSNTTFIPRPALTSAKTSSHASRAATRVTKGSRSTAPS
jgi:hypothetical protein